MMCVESFFVSGILMIPSDLSTFSQRSVRASDLRQPVSIRNIIQSLISEFGYSRIELISDGISSGCMNRSRCRSLFFRIPIAGFLPSRISHSLARLNMQRISSRHLFAMYGDFIEWKNSRQSRVVISLTFLFPSLGLT